MAFTAGFEIGPMFLNSLLGQRRMDSARMYHLRTQGLRRPPDDGRVDAEIVAFDGFWQCQFLDMGLR
jgi:hypothetical protein